MPNSITICQGELAVSGDAGIILSAVLGSCVATCLWDPVTRFGGMNHILLPGQRSQKNEGNKYGIFAMEALINELMKNGSSKADLVAKVFGGAQTFDNALRIGAANGRFVRDFLSVEGIPIVAESLGGTSARRVKFFPESGHAKQLLTTEPVDSLDTIEIAKPCPGAAGGTEPGAGEVELF